MAKPNFAFQKRQKELEKKKKKEDKMLRKQEKTAARLQGEDEDGRTEEDETELN